MLISCSTALSMCYTIIERECSKTVVLAGVSIMQQVLDIRPLIFPVRAVPLSLGRRLT